MGDFAHAKSPQRPPLPRDLRKISERNFAQKSADTTAKIFDFGRFSCPVGPNEKRPKSKILAVVPTAKSRIFAKRKFSKLRTKCAISRIFAKRKFRRFCECKIAVQLRPPGERAKRVRPAKSKGFRGWRSVSKSLRIADF